MTATQLRSLALLALSASLVASLTGLAESLGLPAAAAEVRLAQTQPQTRLRVAVLDFDYASTGADSWWYASPNAAQGVSDLLTNRLVNSGRYTMIERSRIADILAEQNLGAAGRLDASTAAQVGRLLGADAVIIGSVTRFNLDEKGGGGSVFGFGGSSKVRTAEVALTARIVNTTTAEIMAVADGSGSKEQGSSSVSISIFGSVSNSANNDDELLSGAADAAVSQLADKLVDSSSRLASQPQTLPAVNAVVADVSGNTVIINKGAQDGFRTGMMLSVERVEREVRDPQTGAVLRSITAPIGRIELTEVDAKSAVGRIVSGAGLRVGDQARAMP
jgi:curli biogenesis system outer membrane secretion channel CsgG